MAKLIAGLFLFGTVVLLPAYFGEAACAWVLWTNYGTLDPAVPLAFSAVKGLPSGWQPAEAFDTPRACETALNRAEQREWDLIGKRNQGKPKGALWDAYAYRCLPDTVDPRGPKTGEK